MQKIGNKIYKNYLNNIIMNSQNYPTSMQDSMADSEITDSYLPDLTNSSFDSKYKK